jgi:hypothetical protein
VTRRRDKHRAKQSQRQVLDDHGQHRGQADGPKLMRMAAYATIVGAVLAAVTVALNFGPAGSSSHAMSGRAPRLQSIDLVVHNNLDPAHSRIEVILHNVGTGRSIVKGVVLHILHVTQLGICTTQGDLPLSETYDVLLPSHPSPGQNITVPLHEQLASDEADRFALSPAVSGDTTEELPKVSRHIYIFQLNLSILHDTDTAPVNAGDVLIALPNVPTVDEYFLTKEHVTPSFRAKRMRQFGANYFTEFEPCWRANALKIKLALALPGERSEEFTDAVSQMVVLPEKGH